MHKPAGRAAGPWRAAAIAAVAAAALALGGAQESLGTTVSPTMTAEQVRDAIEAKPDSGTVTFNEGTYEGLGNVAIRNDITLQPASGATVILNGSVSLNILSDGVTIQGLTFEDVDSPGTGPDYIGYTSNRYTGVIVLGFNQDGTDPVTADNAGTTLDGILIRGNTIERADYHGILFRPYNADNRVTYSNIEIDGNTINRVGNGDSNAGAIHGGERHARPAAISDLTITDNRMTLPKKTGIDVAEVSGGTITGNTIDRTDSFSIRIAGASDGVTVSGNTATGPSGSQDPRGVGVAVDPRTQNTVIRENTLQRMNTGVKMCDTAGTGCATGDVAPSGTLTVTENSFLENAFDVENSNSPAGTFRAEGNYFDDLPRTPLRTSNVDLFPYYTESSRSPSSLTQEVGIGGDAAGQLLTEQVGAYTRNYTGTVTASDSILGMTLIVNLTHSNPSGELLVGIESPDGTFVELPSPPTPVPISIPLVYSTSIWAGTMPRYLDTLNTFIGSDPSGTWKVALQDAVVDGDTTPVYDWSLSMALEPSAAALVAVPDEASTGQNDAVTIPILDNDLGLAGASNVVVTVPPGQTANGGTPTVTGTSPDFSVSYAPRTGFSGVDTFEYTLSADERASSSATVTVNVGAFYIRDLADRVTDEFVEDSYQIPVANPDGLDLTWRIASDPSDAGAAISDAGLFTWTPSEADGDGVPREFVIEATGTSAAYGQETHRKTLRATANEVNSAPAFDLLGEYEAARGVPFTLDVTATDGDIPEQSLRYTFSIDHANEIPGDRASIDVHQNASLPNYRTPTDPDGTVTMTWPNPERGLDGNHTVTLIVSDQQSPALMDTHAFHLIVPDRSANIGVTSVDPDTITVVTTGFYGSAYDARVLNPDGTVLQSIPDLADAVPAASAQLDLVQEGIYTIQTDTRGGADQWERDSTVTAVFVHPDGHTAQYASDVTASDPPELKIVPLETVTIDVAPHVRTDPRGLPFSVEVTADPEMGSARAVNQTIEYTAADVDTLRTDTIGYTVYVGRTILDTANATVRTTVLAAPDVSRSTAPNFRISMPILADLPDGTVLSLPGLPAPHPNGTVSHPNGHFTFSDNGMAFNPDSGYSGTVEVEYAVARGGATETGTVTMHFYLPEVNLIELDDPYLTQRGKSFLVDINNTRPDVWVPNDLEWEITGTSGGGEFDIDIRTGAVTWTPANETGVQTIMIEVKIRDLEGPDYPLYTIRTIPYDDVWFNATDLVYDNGVQVRDTIINNTDRVPLKGLRVTGVFATDGVDASDIGDASLSAEGVFTWTPTEVDYRHEFLVEYEVGNSTAEAVPADTETARLVVRVGEQNAQPVLDPIGDISVNEDEETTFSPHAVDIDNDEITWRIESTPPLPDPLKDVFDATGSFTWTPDDTYGGMSYRATVTVTDNITAPVQEVITIRVVEVARDSTQNTAEDTPIEFDPDILAPGANVTLRIIGNGTLGTAALIDDDTIEYTPDPDRNGIDEIMYAIVYAADGASTETSGTITINIAPANDPPTLGTTGNTMVSNTHYTVPENGSLTVSVTAMDPADEAPSTVSLADRGGLPGEAVWDEAGDVLTWVEPGEDQGGETYVITVTADDGEDPRNFDITISVEETNELPVLADAGELRAFVGVPFTLDLNATDADRPAQALAYRIASENATGDVTIGADDGIISWTPEVVEAAEVVVEVTDNFTAPGTSSYTLRIEQPPFGLSAGGAAFAPAPRWDSTSTATQVLQASGSCGGVMGVTVSAGPWSGAQGAAGITTSAMVANSTRSGFVELGPAPEVFELQAPAQSPGGQIEVTLRADLPPAPAGLSGSSRPTQDITYEAFCY